MTTIRAGVAWAALVSTPAHAIDDDDALPAAASGRSVYFQVLDRTTCETYPVLADLPLRTVRLDRSVWSSQPLHVRSAQA